ncbi:MAG: aminopeptidase [Candidatus Hodarchaeales archaeon]|jgi:leucyl aminopeptidase (aminopeptidase T)
MNVKEFYKTENDKIMVSYEETLLKINEIFEETGTNPSEEKTAYFKFFHDTAEFILKLCELEKHLDNDYFTSNPYEDLLKENNDLYNELLPENYETSYANPTHCVSVFGDQFGQLLSFFYTQIRNYIVYSYLHKVYLMKEYNQLFIEAFDYIKGDFFEYETLRYILTKNKRKNYVRDGYYRYREQFNTDFNFYTEIINKSDFHDLRYLFKAGNYISENEIKMGQFLSTLEESKLETLTKQIVNAYLTSFERDNKDINIKSTVGVYYQIGLERIYHFMINEFKKHNLKCVISPERPGVNSTNINKQYSFDHKFDAALFIGEKFKEDYVDGIKKGIEKNKEEAAKYSGVMYYSTFGEKPFSPENKKDLLKFSKEQQTLFQSLNNEGFVIYNEFVPASENSFCIVGFPTPKIGEKFEEIFEGTVEINMLDSEKYEHIQQYMIDILDRANTVHVKGKDENKTDIIVKMNELIDPEKETNFENAGATVNIPVGEVFTSPKLQGSNGVLHVGETYQEGLRYDNLKLTFKDGYIEDYSCTNFEKIEENKKYIEENLLFPHKTLPLGEFAIGTNTLAYILAKKFNIFDILPVLILEKTGPHFAIGDTCYSRREDHKVYNYYNKKEIVAKDNEKSILRKTNMMEAYTNKHTDITLAFDDIDFITAVSADGQRTDIIKDGRFVIEGTQELNKPLDENQ